MDSLTKAPWGSWEVLLDANYCKVKRIIVHPEQRLSYQKHQQREEHWTIVKGIGIFTLDGTVQDVTEGDTLFIAKQACHRIENPGNTPLIFIEIQRGSYFGEDDIIRLEDDYHRS